ncbi:MAG: hypothetical protein ABSF12_11285 [Bryobacteraceae bacterium]
MRFVLCMPFLLAVPLLAQPQIGGGICSSSSLSGTYSATFTGRDLSSSVSFSNATQSVGSVLFDGLSKVTFTLTNNTNNAAGTPQTLSGTYSLQSNCVGVLTITSGDAASFTLESYNMGKDYILTGQDASYSLSGSGSLLPTTCPKSIPAGTYAFNGSGFLLTSTTISTVFNILGTITISGTNAIAISATVASGTGSKPISETGTFTVESNCAGTANVTDTSGNAYVLTLEFTGSAGKDFSLLSASPVSIWAGTGRPL